MNYSDWLAERRTGIGGSDVAAILGINPWRTAYDVWQEKRQLVEPQEPNNAMWVGTMLEPAIRQMYADRTGFIVEKPDHSFVSAKYNFMRANLDGIVKNDGRLLEIKTAGNSNNWGAEGTDEIPDYYLTQVQHYMLVKEAELCDVAVLIGGRDFRIYQVKADKELQSMLVDAESDFWQKVVDGIPPEPKTYDDIRQLYKSGFKEESIEASEEIKQAYDGLMSVRNAKEGLEEQEKELLNKIAAFMGDKKTLFAGTHKLASWTKASSRTFVNSKNLKADLPEIYAKYSKVTQVAPSLRFSKII